MKQKRILRTLALCAGSSMLLSTGVADDKVKGEYKGDSKYHTEMRGGHKLMSTSRLIGATVQDQQGQTIGKIQDLVLFPNSGRIEFGLLSLNLPEHDGKVTAVPWQLLRPHEGNVFQLNVEREKLLSAKMWERSATIDFSEPDFARRTYTHYGLSWDDRMSVGGRVDMPGGVDRGYRGSVEIEADDDLKFKRPQPDGRSTFPHLNPDEKEDR